MKKLKKTVQKLEKKTAKLEKRIAVLEKQINPSDSYPDTGASKSQQKVMQSL